MAIPKRADFYHTKHFYIALVLYLFSPILRLYPFFKVKKRKEPIENWKTGIIFGSTHIGDLFYITSSLPILYETTPGCKWYCITEAYSAEIFANNPYLSGVIVTGKYGDQYTPNSDTWNTIKQLSPDAVIIARRTGYHKHLLASINLGIPNRICYGDKGFDFWLTKIITPPEQ